MDDMTQRFSFLNSSEYHIGISLHNLRFSVVHILCHMVVGRCSSNLIIGSGMTRI